MKKHREIKHELSLQNRRRLAAVALLSTAALIAGCSGNGSGGSGGSGGNSGGGTPQPFPSGYVTLSGNWQFEATPAAGSSAPFTALAGYINEEKTAYGNDVTTAALQVNPSASSPCYADATVVPMQGTTKASTIGLLSFNDEQQQLTIDATKNATATQLTGTYSISGGCANGASGTITGTEYADLTGTYSGAISGNTAQTLKLNLTQFTQGTGEGDFLVSGSAAFSGIACFTQGTLASQNGSVLGSSVSLAFGTNDPKGAMVVITGNIDPGADTLTASSITVSGGSCPGPLGTATLKLQ